MAKKILIIQGHPDRDGNRFCRALARAYRQGALEGGAEVREIDVAALDFPLLRTQAEWRGPAPESLKRVIADIGWAEHLLLVYPLWMGTMPALLKGFLEQILRPGVTLDDGANGFPTGGLKGKSARIAITMGMPALAYRWYFRAHSLKNLERNILRFVGVRPIRESLFGLVDAMNEQGARKRLDAFQQTGRKDAA